MDSAVIGVSVLVMLASLLPFIGKFWYINRTLDLVTIGANITMLFAVFIVSVRYRRNGRSLLNFGVLSIICLMVGDSTSVLSHIILGIAPWRGAVYPLYILHYSLLAMGIYRSIDDPPIPPDPSETVMPRLQWLLWLIIPQVFMICVACVAYIINAAPFWVMIVMASFGIAHSVFLAIDLYRVQTQVYQSNERERKARELIRAIQHELKGHTSALTGLVTLMKQLSGQDENKANEVLSIISGSVHELHDLTHKLLILSHEDVNRVVHLREVQLYDLVHSSTELLYANSLDYPINVIVDVPQDVTLQADPLYLSLTIRTALRNSLQAIRQLPAQGAAHISVRTEIVNDYVCLLVEDNGPGFASDILVKLRSSRDVNGKLLPGVSSSIGGYGLGIALIDQVARIHGGSFDFGNCDSGGAWLRIEIPLKPAMS
jgi:signal transduction histidine kinase